MNTIRVRTEIPAFLACTLSLALYIVIGSSASGDWMLDLLTGLVAIVTGLAACPQLVRALSDRRASHLWGLVISALVLVCLAQFFEALRDRRGVSFGGVDFDDYLILAVAPLILWVTRRFDPVFTRARRVAFLGFVIQLISTLLDLRAAELEVDGGPILGSPLTDFAGFLSVSLYLLAVFWIVFDTGRALGLLPGYAAPRSSLLSVSSNGRPGSIRDRLYPPPFILGWHLPPPDTPAGRVHRLCNQALWPAGDIAASVRNLILIALWPVIASVRALKQVRERGDILQQLCGKSKSQQFFEQLKLAIRYRIPPTYYYSYELYRPDRQRLAPHYLMRYETKEIAYRLLYPIETIGSKPTPLKDKVDFARHCQEHDLRHAPTLFVFADGRPANAELPSIDLFVKPVRGKGGRGAERWNASGRGRYRDSRGRELDVRGLLAHIQDLSRFVEPYVVQPAFCNHPSIADLTPGALCTTRMLTCRTENGDFEVTNAAFRMPVNPGSAVDNFHAGGIASSVNVKTGRLGPATNLGMEDGTIWHERHPFTDAQIEGRQLPMWRDAVDLAVRAHRAFDDYALIGWDVALLHDGPILIEGNRGPDVDILQRTGKGPVGNGRFGKLLAYNLEHRPTTSRFGWTNIDQP
ncbi:MAG: sugar-transfer associated ATP-grasp domain-containing protein [Dongiaceae bacterium]